jgi:parallel beta-helix repeat protein
MILLLNAPISLNLSSDGEKTSLDREHSLNIQGDNIFKFSFGTSLGPTDLDPHNAWDGSSINVIDQVCEGLYTYNLSSPNLEIIPNLAAGFGNWSVDHKNYTVPLRMGIVFHDGSLFNAAVVKWNFDRLAYFMNITGTLPGSKEVSIFKALYEWSDGIPIINQTEVISDYVIRFVLNRPYIPFQGLLSFSGSYILSSISTPNYDYIDTYVGNLVGTGPFVYDGYTFGVEVKFHAFNNYWKGKAQIELLTFSIIPDPFDRIVNLISGDVDLLNDPQPLIMDLFTPGPEITLIDDGPSTTIYYIGMNNKQINQTMRYAISYALNYSYIINVIMNNQSSRLKSPIPEGILFANSSLNIATMNISKARQKLVDDSVCNFDINNDNEWTDATLNNPLASYDFSYISGSSTSGEIGLLLKNNLEQIGIDINLDGLNYLDWLDRLNNVSNGHDKLDLYYSGWRPDFNDPSNFITPLLSNRSTANAAQVNDPWLEQKMDAALVEINSTIRETLYDEIQQYIVENLMPWLFCSVPRNFDAYRNYIIGYQSNPMEKVWFYDVSQNSSLFHGKICINGNQEWVYFKNAGKCTGQGTSLDPYIIEDLVIDAEKSGSCIWIENSDVFFEIENCTLQNSGGNWNDAGIYLISVENGQLINNSVNDTSNGVFLEFSHNNDIIGNSISYNQFDAISLQYSDNNYIIGNNLSFNWDYGIYLFNSDGNIISGNTASFNFYGIHLRYSDNNDIKGNVLNYNAIGIYLYHCLYNDVSNNVFNGNTEDIRDDYYLPPPPFPNPNRFLPIIITTLGVVLVVVLIFISVVIFYKNRTPKRAEIPYKKEYTVSRVTPQAELKEIKPIKSPIRKREEESIKFCPHCRQKLYIEAIFCFKCGKRVEQDQVSPSVSEKKEVSLVSDIPQIKAEHEQAAPSISDIKKERFKDFPHYCEFCGIALSKGAVFCPQCGTRVK